MIVFGVLVVAMLVAWVLCFGVWAVCCLFVGLIFKELECLLVWGCVCLLLLFGFCCLGLWFCCFVFCGLVLCYKQNFVVYDFGVSCLGISALLCLVWFVDTC